MQLLRSKIQQINENIAIKNQIKSSMQEGMNNLMDKYNIIDSVFGLGVNGIFEHTNGYFEVTSEYESFEDVMNVWESNQSIRVIDNNKFQLGYVRDHILECGEESQIFDIRC